MVYDIGSHANFTDEMAGAENGWPHSYREAEVGLEQRSILWLRGRGQALIYPRLPLPPLSLTVGL